MATVRGGFLGDLNGSVGNITFARARGGIRTARRRAAPSNPRSAAQQRQRARFKQLQQFASALLAAGLVRTFWQPYATGGLSAYNAFISANAAAMPDAFDPLQAVLSRGNGLTPVALADVSEEAPGRYRLTLTDGPGDPDDLLVGVLYNARRGRAVLADAGATRGDGGLTLDAPPTWPLDEDDALVAYAFAYQADGGQLLLSDSTTQKVIPGPLPLPEPDVPAPQRRADRPFGSRAGA